MNQKLKDLKQSVMRRWMLAHPEGAKQLPLDIGDRADELAPRLFFVLDIGGPNADLLLYMEQVLTEAGYGGGWSNLASVLKYGIYPLLCRAFGISTKPWTETALRNPQIRMGIDLIAEEFLRSERLPY